MPVDHEHYHIWGSFTVSVLFQNYEITLTLCCWALGRETSDVFHAGLFCKFWT